MTLNLSRGFKLPLDAATDKFAFLARTGAGKTYSAGVFAEELLDAGVQIVVLDPVGKWWGLRLAADGKTPAYEIPVFGGNHGDMRLNKDAGAVIADVVVDEGISAVLDVSDFILSEQRRFVTDLVTRLLQRKKKTPSPIHLFFEEAQEFAPQRVMGEDTKMVSAVQRLIKLGRNYGVGASLISQRAASVNKDVLTQTEVLCVLQTTGPQDRKAIRDWIDHSGADVTKDVFNTLPKLGVGEMYIWSPGRDLYKRTKFRKKHTFDTSATPKVGKKQKVRKLGDIDVGKIQAAIEKAVGDQKADDPRHLRLRIRELEKAVAEGGGGGIEVERIVEVPVTVVTPQDIDNMDITINEVEMAVKQLRAINEVEMAVKQLRAITKSAHKAVERVQRGQMPFGSKKPTAAKPVKLVAPVHERPNLTLGGRPSNGANGDVKIKRGARRMLAALAAQTQGISKLQLGTLVGMKHTGGTFNDYLGTLRRAGLVATAASGAYYAITDEGRAFIGSEALDVPSTTAEILALWRPKFKAGARKILDLLVERFPATLSKPEIGDAVGNSYTGGTFNDYLGTLVRNGVVVKIGGNYAASEDLFL